MFNINDNIEIAKGAGGALSLVDAMIKVQGLEKTLEDIRAVVKTHPSYDKSHLGIYGDRNNVIDAWKGMMAFIVLINKKMGRE